MKNTIEIARAQLARLFFSPVIWLILIILFVQVGFAFAELIEYYETNQRQGTGYLYPLSEMVFATTGLRRPGVIHALAKNLYLYLPLLTMGLLSSELSSGSIKLLYSSPISIRQLVFGKYLSMVVFSLLIILCLFSFIVYGSLLIENFDFILTISGLLGVFLLSCTYISVGVFISSLSSSQIIVAVSTFVMLTFLNFVPNLGQEIPYLSEVAFWLSLTTRSDDFIQGLIKSQNIAYFLVMIALFISITIIRLKALQRSTPLFRQVLSYGMVLSIVLTVGWITSKPSLNLYADMSRTGRSTIHEQTQTLLQEMKDGPLSMNIYANILDPNVGSALPSRQNSDKRKWESYQRFKPDMDFNYIYFYDSVENVRLFGENPELSLTELAKKMADAYGIDFDKVLTPQEIEELVDLSAEENQYIREFAYKGKKAFVRMFDGIRHYPGEAQISASIRQLVEGPITLGFISNHSERSFSSMGDTDYKSTFALKHQDRKSLLNLGLSMESVDLSKGIPAHIDILVVADPKQPYSEAEIRSIIQFIEEGKNAFIAIEPNDTSNIKDILSYFGVEQLEGQLTASENQDYAQNLILSRFINYPEFYPNYWLSKFVIDYDYPITTPTVSAFQYDTLNSKWTIAPFLVAKQVYLDNSRSETDQIPVSLMLQQTFEEREQRILLFGDADFASNAEMSRRNVIALNGRGFLPFVFHWLSNERVPLDLSEPEPIDTQLNIGQVKGRSLLIIKTIYMGLIPGLLFISGAFILIRRKRR